jgi:hypothetical protein
VALEGVVRGLLRDRIRAREWAKVTAVEDRAYAAQVSGAELLGCEISVRGVGEKGCAVRDG